MNGAKLNHFLNRSSEIKKIADKFEYAFVMSDQNTGMLSFRKESKRDGVIRIDIYITKMTVTTSLTHDKKGKSQLIRKNVSDSTLFSIFENPRVHTGKGVSNTAKIHS